MANFWNTQTKRIATMLAMGLSGWTIVKMSFPALPALPEFVTKTWIGSVSIMTVAGAFLIYAIYLMFDNQLNG